MSASDLSTYRPAEHLEPTTFIRRSNAELQELLEDAPIGIHWVDAHGTIVWANRTELKMLGYTADEYIGRHIAEFHVDADVIADILARLLNGQSIDSYEAR